MFSDLFADDRLLRSYSVLCGIPEPVAAEILQRKNELPLEAAAALRARDERFAERLSADLQCVYACLLILEDVPLTIAQHRERGFPWEITLETLSDIGIWCNDLFKREKRCGILPAQIKWLNHQKNMEIVRIGRFQYMTRPCFGGRIKVFRRKKRTGYRILAEHGLSMTREGQRTEENAAFHTVYRENAQSFSGNPVENGYVRPDSLDLSCEDWEKVLEYGDPMLSIHIPADGPMTPEISLCSLRKAAEFFRTYYPDMPWKGFWCHSWLLDPFLRTLLPPSSNILRFQELGMLYPVSGDSNILSRLMPTEGGGTTRFHQAVTAAVAEGHIFHNGGWFLFRGQIEMQQNPKQIHSLTSGRNPGGIHGTGEPDQ